MIADLDKQPLSLIVTSFIALVLFFMLTYFQTPTTPKEVMSPGGKVVIAAPLQIFMYGGDRFLAANVEEMRVTSMGTDENESLALYRLRAYELVSQLNPCHEDNYYFANAMLTWGGSVDSGSKILQHATDCRFWDEFPPFFIGFNQYFFNRDFERAQEFMMLAADRSKKNQSRLRSIAFAIGARKLNDEKMAIAYLQHQRDQTDDQELKANLERRVKRVEGLLKLRQAQKEYEAKYHHALTDPMELFKSGILKESPKDPLRIGYEFIDGRFHLRALRMSGREVY